jgi:hypothetical protein
MKLDTDSSNISTAESKAEMKKEKECKNILQKMLLLCPPKITSFLHKKSHKI